MVAQTERAFLAIARQRSEGADREDPGATRRWTPSSSRAKATSSERQQLTERARHHKKSSESRNDAKKSPDPTKLHSLAALRVFLVPRACDVTMAAGAAEVKAQYSATVLGATGNVGGRIVQLLIKSPLCKKVVVVTRRKTDAFADPKVYEVVVNMDRIEEEVAPHAQGVNVALVAFGVGKGGAKMPEEEVRKIEIAYPQAFCRAAKAGDARVCGVMTAAGADPEAGMKYTKIIGEKEKAVESVKFDFLGVYRPGRHSRQRQHAGHPWLRHAAAALGDAVQVPLDPQERPRARDGGAVGAGVPRGRAGQPSQGGDREDPGVQGDGALLRQGRERRALSSSRYPKLDFPFANDSLGAARWHIDD
jgi:hypothetical protein